MDKRRKNTKGRQPEPMTQPLLDDKTAALLAKQYSVRPRTAQSAAKAIHKIHKPTNS
jgi:hypothetical protein